MLGILLNNIHFDYPLIDHEDANSFSVLGCFYTQRSP